MVHILLCLHGLFRVAGPLHSNQGGDATWGMFPRGCEDTVARKRVLLVMAENHIKTQSSGLQ